MCVPHTVYQRFGERSCLCWLAKVYADGRPPVYCGCGLTHKHTHAYTHTHTHTNTHTRIQTHTQFLQPMYPGMLKQIRKNVFTAVSCCPSHSVPVSQTWCLSGLLRGPCNRGRAGDSGVRQALRGSSSPCQVPTGTLQPESYSPSPRLFSAPSPPPSPPLPSPELVSSWLLIHQERALISVRPWFRGFPTSLNTILHERLCNGSTKYTTSHALLPLTLWICFRRPLDPPWTSRWTRYSVKSQSTIH